MLHQPLIITHLNLDLNYQVILLPHQKVQQLLLLLRQRNHLHQITQLVLVPQERRLHPLKEPRDQIYHQNHLHQVSQQVQVQQLKNLLQQKSQLPLVHQLNHHLHQVSRQVQVQQLKNLHQQKALLVLVPQ